MGNEGVEKLRIMLITNKNSDNMGDKVIEICDIALIQVVMQNLGIENYEILSYDANIAYKDNAADFFDNKDIVLLGGAPLLNFKYQNFYQRTIKTIELAKERNIPVVFSAIGIDCYDEHSMKCQELKEALNSDCVKQITTRDGYEFLEQYKSNEQLVIGKVADPAVWTSGVFENFICDQKHKKGKIGIFVIRAEGFTDNGIDFPRAKMIELYKGLAENLENKGYDYEFLTSGHFADDAFMDYMIRWENMDNDKFVFNMNTPETLIKKISSYDGIITCRLHPSIVAYSLGVPSVSIVWNPKVEGFYDSIGYQDRVLYTDDITADSVVACLEKAIQQGVNISNDYLMSVYFSLFNGIVLALDNPSYSDIEPYTLEEVKGNMISFDGTSTSEKDSFVLNKFRRTYGTFNKNIINNYIVIYNSGMNAKNMTYNFDEAKGEIRNLGSGSVEFWDSEEKINGEDNTLLKNTFSQPDYTFLGWNMRIKLDQGKWLWCLEDGSLIPMNAWTRDSKNKKIFADESAIPDFSLIKCKAIVVEAAWCRNEIEVLYNCGVRYQNVKWTYTDEEGEVKKLSSGSYEFNPVDAAKNDGTSMFKKNKFIRKNYIFKGWKLRICIKGEWYWYLSDGTLFPKDKYNEQEVGISVKIFADEDKIPYIMDKSASLMVANAVWGEKERVLFRFR